MIKIQFPKSETNTYWDGKEHDIEPKNFAQINQSEYYYLDGLDKNFNQVMYTLLRKNETGFNKVPLDNYSEFRSLLADASTDLNPIEIEAIGEKVGLDPIMTVEELKEAVKSRSL